MLKRGVAWRGAGRVTCDGHNGVWQVHVGHNAHVGRGVLIAGRHAGLRRCCGMGGAGEGGEGEGGGLCSRSCRAVGVGVCMPRYAVHATVDSGLGYSGFWAAILFVWRAITPRYSRGRSPPTI